MSILKKIIKNRKFQIGFAILIIFCAVWFWPQEKVSPKYGVTFSAKYARELKLDPEETLEQIITDLDIKKIRLVAYWDDIQSEEGRFNFRDLDWQIKMARTHNAEVILSVGRRVPRWPECHIPYWALQLNTEQQKEAILKMISETVVRYKDEEVIKAWQVENEPFLTSYAKQYCGGFDAEFLDKEIALVKDLDFNTPILMTDSGELSTWRKAYSRGDQFGSTFYVYVANNFFEDVRSIMSHNTYRYKLALMKLFFGDKPSYLIEVSIEPWLTKPIIHTSFVDQLDKMNIKRAKTILDIAAQTGFSEQYLWGAEWWYYLKVNGYPELWDYIKDSNK